MRRGHDVKGRSVARLQGRDRRVNGPPEGEPWAWMTRAMLESPAWAALSIHARRIIDRVLVEHMAHGGTQNGALPVSYADIEALGIRRNRIASAIAEAVALGFLDHRRGRAAGGSAKGHVQVFRLTWLRTGDGEPATNRWKALDAAEAQEKAAAAKEKSADARYATRRPTGKI